ncbi:guanylate kinase [Faunimonas sp. B44]|uniref:guanylate kinase n=1 Tax=Faunimonas sp. B44 TaxID=3461493 RepID=UPI004044C711
MTSEPALLPRRGLMFVLSSPSGAGKSTLTRLLLEAHRDLQLSISVTTRAKRPSEIEGRHYFFRDQDEFRRMRDRGDLLEWAEVHGNFYGTPREPVEKALAQGRDVLFDIDWQGTEQLCRDAALAPDIVRVFVLPPSFRELKARLERRAEDNPDVIERRLRNAIVEIGKWFEYEYVIVNEDLERSYEAVRSILIAERFRRTRFTTLAGFVEGLIDEGEALLGAEQPARAGTVRP